MSQSVLIPNLSEENTIKCMDKPQLDIWYHTTKLYIDCIHQIYHTASFPIYIELGNDITKLDLK